MLFAQRARARHGPRARRARFIMHTQAMEAWNHVCPDLLHTPYYARSITSIMPGQAWRDTGHKGLMPGVTYLKSERHEKDENVRRLPELDCSRYVFSISSIASASPDRVD